MSEPLALVVAAVLLPLADGMFSASGVGGFGGFANLTFYDYATGDIRWTVTREYEHNSPQSADRSGCRRTASTSTPWCGPTGRGWSSWTPRPASCSAPGCFDDDIGFDLEDAEVYIHDDLRVWLSQFDSSVTKKYAATFRLG